MAMMSKQASTSLTHAVTGSHQFKVAHYSFVSKMEYGSYVSSAKFTVDDYDWVIQYYPNCTGTYRGYAKLRLRLETEAHITVDITFVLRSNSQKPASDCSRTTLHTFKNCVSTKEVSNFSDLMFGTIDTRQLVKNDCLTIECIVTILKPSRLARSIAVPPSQLSQDFGSLLKGVEGTDITFVVNSERFNAHRCVLAARSPVFKVELFGHMKEKESHVVNVTGIEAVVFKAMLHFIYTDSSSELNELINDSSEDSSTAMAQHLLVAADRYGLERLKFICADMLYKNIKRTNVMKTLALADRHSCLELKDACFEFIATSMNLRDVMMDDEFEDLIQNCPSILKELRAKFSSI